MKYRVKPSSALRGEITVPGDKSISHRSIMLASIADGNSRISGFLEGKDCLATLRIFRSMGVKIDTLSNGELLVQGVGLYGLQPPQTVLDVGNSGTCMRLLAGLLAGQRFSSTLTGDSSVRRRPMDRVIEPLREMGAEINLGKANRPPITISATQPKGRHTLKGITYQMPLASAQVKSCLLLAGLYANDVVSIIEPAPTRNHTELMLKTFGVNIETKNSRISMQPNQRLKATRIQIPGDISSAAFFIVAASIISDSDIVIRNVGVNPTRMGCITILKAMGAQIEIVNRREMCGEPVADLHVTATTLRGIDIPTEQIPLAIDEFPIIFIAAAFATGQTTLRNAAELRHKESDRLHAMTLGLQKLGIACEEEDDGIVITGGLFHGNTVDAHGDHRIAMAFSIAGLYLNDPKQEVIVTDCEAIQTSFPTFFETLNTLSTTSMGDAAIRVEPHE